MTSCAPSLLGSSQQDSPSLTGWGIAGLSGLQETEMLTFAPSYHLWRKAVFARDEAKCIQCGSADRPQADHVLSVRSRPDLRLCIENGRVLCTPCHKTTATFGAKQLKGTRRIAGGDEYGSL